MAKQLIDTGVTPDDPSADTIREGFTKVNINTNEIYAAGPVGSDITISGNTLTSNTINSNLYLVPNGDGQIYLQKKTIAGTINADIINVHTNFNADVINVAQQIVSPAMTVDYLSADEITVQTLTVTGTQPSTVFEDLSAESLTIDGDTVLNRSVTINAGASQFFKVTDGDALNPEDLFTVDGENGRVSVLKRFHVDLDLPEPDREGSAGDLRGDVVYTEDYIFVCYEDWVDATPAAQPNIWSRFSNDNWI